jgi:TatD DNase family protein
MAAPSWTDTHAHLDRLDKTPAEAVAECLAAGVDRIITIGTHPEDLPIVLSLAESHAPHVFCTLGVHPHDAQAFSDDVEVFLRSNLTHPRVVAVGEIGLDFHYEHSPRDTQEKAFRRQLDLAVEFGLPVEIHTRDAEEDTVRVLREYGGAVRGVLHCFTGTPWLAERSLDLGLDLSISGVVTFKNAESLRAIVKNHPLDRLHVETDSPFLAPVPHRGQKNRPVWVTHVAQCVADLKGITLEELSSRVRQNTKRVFGKID